MNYQEKKDFNSKYVAPLMNSEQTITTVGGFAEHLGLDTRDSKISGALFELTSGLYTIAAANFMGVDIEALKMNSEERELNSEEEEESSQINASVVINADVVRRYVRGLKN